MFRVFFLGFVLVCCTSSLRASSIPRRSHLRPGDHSKKASQFHALDSKNSSSTDNGLSVNCTDDKCVICSNDDNCVTCDIDCETCLNGICVTCQHGTCVQWLPINGSADLHSVLNSTKSERASLTNANHIGGFTESIPSGVDSKNADGEKSKKRLQDQALYSSRQNAWRFGDLVVSCVGLDCKICRSGDSINCVRCEASDCLTCINGQCVNCVSGQCAEWQQRRRSIQETTVAKSVENHTKPEQDPVANSYSVDGVIQINDVNCTSIDKCSSLNSKKSAQTNVLILKDSTSTVDHLSINCIDDNCEICTASQYCVVCFGNCYTCINGICVTCTDGECVYSRNSAAGFTAFPADFTVLPADFTVLPADFLDNFKSMSGVTVLPPNFNHALIGKVNTIIKNNNAVSSVAGKV